MIVIPANAGIQLEESSSEMDPRLRGDDNECYWEILNSYVQAYLQ